MEIIMPQFGETLEEGTVVVWHKQPGDRVEKGETLLEVSTDKVDTEIPAPASGRIKQILVSDGETVGVGEVLAILTEEKPADGDVDSDDLAATSQAAPSGVKRGVRADTAPGHDKLSPAVRRLLSEHQLEASEIKAGGRGGRIRKQDVLAHIERRGGSRMSEPAGEESSYFVAFDRIRQQTAQHMALSKRESPHVVQAIEVDFENISRLREQVRDDWSCREGFSLTFLPFIAHAVCRALLEHPRLNARLEGEGLRVQESVHLGIAVDLDGEGLLVPVIADSHRKSVAELARAIRQAAGRAREKKMSPQDLRAGTYTISNNGAFGTLLTAPIIHQPQVAILSVDSIRRRPWVVGEEERIEIRSIGLLTQCFDHRAVDGAYAAAFLEKVRQFLEQDSWDLESIFQ